MNREAAAVARPPAAGPAPDPSSPLAPGRTCGSCSMCCKVLGIPEVNSLPGQWCVHVAQGRGCAIHATRPDSCRAFYCHYLRNPNLGPEWKPDRAKFVLSVEAGGRRMVVAPDPKLPSAWRQAPYYAQLKRWALAGLGANHQVLVFEGKRATAILPDRDVDLGTVEVGDEVMYRRGPGGVELQVRRKSG